MVQYINWPGISGQIYQAELCVAGIPFAQNPGVYIFCKPAGNVWAPVYVGECENFNDRLNINLANHHRIDSIKSNGATNVCVIRVDGGKQARVNVETDLRKQLNPPCNLQ